MKNGSIKNSASMCGKSIAPFIISYLLIISGKTSSFVSINPTEYIDKFNKTMETNATFEKTNEKDVYNIKL